MEAILHCPPAIAQQVAALAVALRASGIRDPAVSQGAEAAEVAGALTTDEDLAVGTLLHIALGGVTDRERAALFATTGVAHGLASARALEVAEQLSSIGELGLPGSWAPATGLDARQAEILRKMLLAVASDPRFVVARLAVQLVRLRGAKGAPATDRQRLALETQEIYAPLASRLGVWQLKWELEDLAFRYLHDEDYRRLAAALNEKRADRERYIEALCDTLRTELARAGVNAEVYGRPKHIFSIYRKMQRKQLAFEQVFDVRAVRIVCADVPQCYAALGVVHGRWPYIQAEFDDYIATPKDNDYRSIHTAVVGPEGKPVEVQIRTAAMHEHAELGVAAHWRYKEGRARDAAYERKIEWVRRLLDPGDAPEGAADFIEQVRAELFEDRIYVMTPKGELKDLPRGATPLDFAYHLHSDIGHRCKGAKVNGRIVPLTYALKNGEVVEIITGKTPSPSRDWLAPEQGFLVSSRNRSKVRAWFRKLGEADNRAAGRIIMERELGRVGAGPQIASALVQELKAHDLDTLHRWLGEGEVSVTQLLQAAERLLAPLRAPAAPVRPAQRRTNRGSAPIEIEGVGDLPVTLARCCSPMRPQPIVGYVTLGRGVTVHRATCTGLARMRASRPERVLECAWVDAEGSTLPVEVTVTAFDRRGLVRDLTDVLAAERLSIESLNTTTDRNEGTATTIVRVGVRDLAHLAHVMRRLGAVGNVIGTRRTG